MSGAGDEFERRVRERAYHLWQDAGEPDGQGNEFWHRACLLEEAETAPVPADPVRSRFAERRIEAEIEEPPATRPPPATEAAAEPGDARGTTSMAADLHGFSIFDVLARSARRGGEG